MTKLALRLALVGAERQTDTKASFWREYRRLSQLGERHGEIPWDDDYLEGYLLARIQVRLNRALKRHFGPGLEKEPSGRYLDDIPQEFSHLTLRISRVEYSSLELLIDVLGLNDGKLLPLIVAALEIYAPEELSNALPGRDTPFRPSVHVVEWPVEATPTMQQPTVVPAVRAPEESDRFAAIRKISSIANLSLLLPVVLGMAVLYAASSALSEHEKENFKDRADMRAQTTALINATVERNKTLEGALKEVLASAAQVIQETHRIEMDILKERARQISLHPDTNPPPPSK